MLILYIFLSVFAVMNVVTFGLYVADKRNARKGKWRISEKALLLCSFFCGGIGGLIAMLVFRHKTRREHWYFYLVNILGILIQITIIILLFVYVVF